MELFKNYINGEWVEAISGKTRKILNPATGQVIGKAADSDIEDTKAAITAAKESFYGQGEWRRSTNKERAAKLLQIAAEIDAATEELSLLESIDTGMTVDNARGNIIMGKDMFNYYAGYILSHPSGEVNPLENTGITSITVREPIGVCALITPWNVPMTMLSWKASAALAAGNSIIVKPASNTPYTTQRIFQIFEKVGFPKGVVNLVMGPGSTVGNELASSMDVDAITMTGSTAVGQDIIRASASNVKKVGLELGGKSPLVVFADANLDSAAQWSMLTCFSNQGANCCAGSRVFVEESAHDEFVKILKEKTEKIKVGIGQATPNPYIGSLVSKEQLKTVLDYIESGKADGAEVVTGGYQLTEGEYAKGNFVRPTIFDKCTPDMKIVREEIFGPVMTIQTFKTEEEAIAKANDTNYGLGSGVFTENIGRAQRVASELRAGLTWINQYNQAYVETPWGGYKMSGTGRELGLFGIEEFQEVKCISMRNDSGDPGLFE